MLGQISIIGYYKKCTATFGHQFSLLISDYRFPHKGCATMMEYSRRGYSTFTLMQSLQKIHGHIYGYYALAIHKADISLLLSIAPISVAAAVAGSTEMSLPDSPS